MPAYKIVLISCFGRNAQRPLRAAMLRLGILFGISLASGYVLSRSMPGIGTMLSLTPDGMEFFVTMSLQILVAGSLLLTNGFNVHTTLTGMLMHLPLTNRNRNLALLIPKILVCGLMCCLALPVFVVSLRDAGIPWLGISACMAIGIGGGFGLAEGLPFKRQLTRLMVLAVAFGIGYILWHYTGEAHSDWSAHTPMAKLTLLMPVILLIHIPRNLRNSLQANSIVHQVRTSQLPGAWWFIKKLLRTKAYRVSLATSLSMGVLLCLTLPVQLVSMIGSATILLLAGLCAADIRGISRRNMPAEIAGLKAVPYFNRQSAVSGMICSCLALSPVLWRIGNAHIGQIPFLAINILLGTSIGIFIGNLVVPITDNVSSQCLTLLLCMGCMVALERIPMLAQLSPVSAALSRILISALLLVAADYIEYKRNTYRWKRYATTNNPTT